ncbi:prolyl endopeptidase-like isoform X2 [Durio zibethinus]|uniref:Prolyl endopeptidase n=1 Tax=Durio zibethinus TaxID=66656 RepID=A0A6P6AWP4_DURZI|nr:prolyl endopeptidase-like isoform X2 [Durio zibethinus]
MGSLGLSEGSFGQFQYPIARRDESVVDDYHGIKVADPYRWLEDADAEEVKKFVQKQVTLTESVLEKCDTRSKLHKQITKLFDHPRYTVPFKRGNKYFYFHNTGLQAQNVLYMQVCQEQHLIKIVISVCNFFYPSNWIQDGLDGEPEVLLDPNTLSEDGTVSLKALSVSEDAKYLGYGLSSSGSDWVTIKVRRVEDKTGELDSLSWIKFSEISWTHDSKGFFYSRYPVPKDGENLDSGIETSVNVNHELYYHFLGTNQSEDILCWSDPENPKHMFSGRVTDDGKYLLLYIDEGCGPVNKLYHCDMSALPKGLEGFRERNGPLPFVKLIDQFDAQYLTVANDDSSFTFLTNKDAPKYKLVRVDLKEPSKWIDVIPEDEKDVLESACAVNGNQMIVSYLSDVKYVLQVRDLKTGSMLHKLPIDIGTVYGISARREDSMVFIGFTSFLTPGIIYQCNLRVEFPEMNIFREINVPGFDRSDFKINQVFVQSKDGTKIPMFIVGKKDINLDGSHPCLLYGYGGFNVSLTPSFSVSRIVLARHLGAFFCIANIRGGGEYGEEWHKAGALSKKQTCFNDFISAAEYLISSGYTQPKKLCIEGGSNGGLLVGACINQRPELFGCALAHVGVMDMLRFHKFTIGHAWTCDFGCSDKEEEFQWLIKYSPLHNVRRPWETHPGGQSQYPSTMLLTADHDDRVVPLHSLKMLAVSSLPIIVILVSTCLNIHLHSYLLKFLTHILSSLISQDSRFACSFQTMQYVLCTSLQNSPQTNPIIGRIECKAGHGCGRPTYKLVIN